MRKPIGILKNVFSQWTAFLVNALTGFLLSPFVVECLGSTGYGIWTLLTAVVGYLGLLDFGVRVTVTHFVAKWHAVGNSQECSKFVSAGVLMFAGLGILAILIAIGVALYASLVFNIPAERIEETRVILIIGGVSIAVALIGGVFGGVVAGLERFDVISGIDVCVCLGRAAVVVWLLSDGHGLIALALIHLSFSLINSTANFLAARRLIPELRLIFGGNLLPHIRLIMGFSVYLSALQVFGKLIFFTDALVIAAFLPVGLVTFFAIAGNLADYGRQLASALSMLMMPRASALSAAGSVGLKNEIVGAASVATLITAPVATTYWIRGESFISLWMGAEYGPLSGSILFVLSFVVLFSGARAVATSSIVGVDKHRALVPIYAAEAACNIVLSIVLIKPFGLLGVALGTAIPNAFVTIFLVPRCLSQAIDIEFKRFVISAWIRPILACVPFAVLTFVLEKVAPATNLLSFFLQVAVLLPTVVVVGAFVCLEKEERRGLAARLSSIFSKD